MQGGRGVEEEGEGQAKTAPGQQGSEDLHFQMFQIVLISSGSVGGQQLHLL